MIQKTFIEAITEKAQLSPCRVVLPETFDERTLLAAARIYELKTAVPILIGNKKSICEKGSLLGIEKVLSELTYIDKDNDPERRVRYAQILYEQRKEKGMTLMEAEKLMNDLNYFSVMVVQSGDADGMVTGANSPSHNTLRPALQIIKTKEKFHKVSGFFFMVWPTHNRGDSHSDNDGNGDRAEPIFQEFPRLLLFADCMVNIEPSSHELAEIAIDTAETAQRFGIQPRIAMLSFSTNGSAKHPNVDRVREATQMVQSRRPDLLCEGEMQVDAALVPDICKKKFPTSKICGDANVLIFPNLESANIAYKLVERLAGAQAIGPILQGLTKPVNDLSRGCSVNDIVHLAAITSIEAHEDLLSVKTFSTMR